MPSYVVNLQGGGQMTVNASSPAAAVANVIAQGGTPAANTSVTSAPSSAAAPSSGGSSGTPALNRDLTLAFVVLVLAGVAIAVSSWHQGAQFVQWGLVIAIVVVVLRGEPQITRFLSFLNVSSS